ncbi:hypothetical protein BGY98DRAFT_1000772 [Russula aff. rugulosa BPL654]|nr:hypothetical protein BGY98DRAFT_1000772 [Russula aff. rugulosa BPL654]
MPPHLPCLVLILSPPHCSLVSLFPSTIPYSTIDSRTSLPNGRVTPLVHKLPHHCPMQHLPTITKYPRVLDSFTPYFSPYG